MTTALLSAAADSTGLFVIALALAVGMVVLIALLAALLVRARQSEASLRKLDGLADLHSAMKRAGESRDALDLRRVEHVLIDIRDGQKRLEERLFALVEARHRRSSQTSSSSARESKGGSGRTNGSSPPISGAALSDRIVDRLLALGYERVEIITPLDKLEVLAREGGEAQVEARRDGALHKGRAIVRAGTIADVQLRASYEIFP